MGCRLVLADLRCCTSRALLAAARPMSYSFSQQRWHISDNSRTRESPLLFSLRLHSSVLRSLARVSGANIEAIWPWGPAFPRNLGKHRLEMQTQSTRWMMPSCSAPFYYFYYCHSGLWVPAQKNIQKQKTNKPTKIFPWVALYKHGILKALSFYKCWFSTRICMFRLCRLWWAASYP